MIRFFTYGTLRRRGRLEALAGSRPTGPKRAHLRGYRKVNTPFGYPVVLRDENSSVWGYVWEFDEAEIDLAYVDRYEGLFEDPPYYFRVTETVLVEGEELEAYVYVGNPDRFEGVTLLGATEKAPEDPDASFHAGEVLPESGRTKSLAFDTLAAHGAEPPDSDLPQPLSEPISQTSVFAFRSLEQLDDVWTRKTPGYIYSRMANPNTDDLQRTIALLEGGEEGLVASSGTSAILAVLLAAAGTGGHVVATREAYGGTHTLLDQDLPERFGVQVTLVDVEDLDAVREAVKPSTRVLYLESITNPLIRLAPISKLVDLARERGLTVVVDNTFATPYLLNPLRLGADVSVHSATKFMNGHGDVMLGVAAGRKDIIHKARELVTRYGLNADPFAAWLVSRGLKTLPVRMKRAVSNAERLAQVLNDNEAVSTVYYPGLAASPYHQESRRLMPRGAGAMLSFDLSGGLCAARKLIENLQLVRFVPSLGDVTTTISHPVLTSHRGLSASERERLGIAEGLIRVSVGIEDPEDIAADFVQALAHTER